MFDVNDEEEMMVNIQTNMNSQSYVELIINSDFDNIFVSSQTTGNPSKILSLREDEDIKHTLNTVMF